MGFEFCILGRGRLGRALSEALDVANHPHTERPEGFVVLAVPDHAIEHLASQFQGRVVHTSGSIHLPGVPCLHPLTSFDGTVADWRGTPLARTGGVPPELVERFEALGFKPFDLPESLKPLYHAAAVLSSGHAATLWLGAEALLRSRGVELPGEGLRPLARATLKNIEQHGASGRTGPFARKDEATIERDRAALPPPWNEIFLRLGRALDEP